MPERRKLKLLPRTLGKVAGIVNITPPSEEIDNSLPAYYVTMDEGALFQIESTPGLYSVLTQGLCGCVAIPILIKYNEKTYIFLNHIDADTDRNKGVDTVLLNVLNTIKAFNEDLKDFEFRNPNYNTTIGVAASGFGENTTLAHAVLQKLTNILGPGRECFMIQCRSIAFILDRDNRTGRITEPEGVSGKSLLSCYGTRQAGYGPSTKCTEAPYVFDKYLQII
jgi:hypothetical protein